MSCQVQSAQKRKRQDAAEIEVLQRKASQVDSVKAARTKAKEHRSKANARIEKGLASGGAELEPMAKSRALRSDANGEMIGLDLCLRCCCCTTSMHVREFTVRHIYLQVLVQRQQGSGHAAGSGNHKRAQPQRRCYRWATRKRK